MHGDAEVVRVGESDVQWVPGGTVTFKEEVMALLSGTVVSLDIVAMPTAAYAASVGEVPWKPLFSRSWPCIPPSPDNWC